MPNVASMACVTIWAIDANQRQKAVELLDALVKRIDPNATSAAIYLSGLISRFMDVPGYVWGKRFLAWVVPILMLPNVDSVKSFSVLIKKSQDLIT